MNCGKATAIGCPFRLGVKNRRALDRLPKVGARVDEWLKVDTRNIGWHGNAILVRPDVGVLDVAALELPTLEPRGAVLVELLVRDRPIRIIGLHLDLSGLWRRRQLKAICEAVKARPQAMPTVMMGDTNEWRATAACLRDLEPDFAIVAPGPSFHARRPMAVLDRLFVDRSLTCRGVRGACQRSGACRQRPSARLGSDRLVGSRSSSSRISRR